MNMFEDLMSLQNLQNKLYFDNLLRMKMGTDYPSTPQSEFWNKNTIPGEVIEDDNGTAHRGSYFPYISRYRRHVPEYTLFTGGACRCFVCRWAYEGKPRANYGGPRFSVIPQIGETLSGSAAALDRYRLRKDIGGYRFQDGDFSTYEYGKYYPRVPGYATGPLTIRMITA